jgi:hypothetical protein
VTSSEHYFNRFSAEVFPVLRVAAFAPRRAWLGVDGHNVHAALDLPGFFFQGSYAFQGHPSDLMEHLCMVCMPDFTVRSRQKTL